MESGVSRVYRQGESGRGEAGDRSGSVAGVGRGVFEEAAFVQVTPHI